MELYLTNKINATASQIIICSSIDDLKSCNLSKDEIEFAKQCKENKQDFIEINHYKYQIFIQFANEKKNDDEFAEYMRKQGSKFKSAANKYNIEEIQISEKGISKAGFAGFIEGIILSHYQFDKYKSKKNDNKLKSIKIYGKLLNEYDLQYTLELSKSVHFARTLVNEPYSYLDTEQLSKEIRNLSEKSGFKLEILEKKQIESLKMGGLLAVNQGSNSQPNFSVLSWKPDNAKNNKPLVLVGKGIVFDTGGLSLKPTKNSMDYMKCDMAGAAVVVAVLSFAAKMQLPYHIVGLVPATDNAISNKAYVPGDVITMHNKKTVEVLNTDAEGRLILADALSYAEKYNPKLVVDIATLTGAAAYTLGYKAAAILSTADKETCNKMIKAGFETGEKLVELPLWEEYIKEVKSEIADVKNIGSPMGGTITAAAFLKHFTSYDWIHLDIAGPAYLHKAEDYKTYGGTGFGVRLLCQFINRHFE